MDEKMFTFGDIEIEKNKFSSYKKSQFSEDADIDSVLISDKISTGERNYKYFIGYLYNNYKIKPLHKMLPIPSAYINNYDEETNWIYFLIKDGDLLNKYNTIQDKINADAKTEPNGKAVYYKKILKTKTKSCCNEATDFHDKEVLKVDSSYTCLNVISLNSVFEVCENYYPQVSLKECRQMDQI